MKLNIWPSTLFKTLQSSQFDSYCSLLFPLPIIWIPDSIYFNAARCWAVCKFLVQCVTLTSYFPNWPFQF